MQVNATTLIQILNFWITYFFLKKFFFKPIVRVLLQKDALRKALRDDLKYKETALFHLQEKKTRQTVDFKDQIKKNYQFEPFQPSDIPCSTAYHQTEEELNALTDATKELLIKKVPHAF